MCWPVSVCVCVQGSVFDMTTLGHLEASGMQGAESDSALSQDPAMRSEPHTVEHTSCSLAAFLTHLMHCCCATELPLTPPAASRELVHAFHRCCSTHSLPASVLELAHSLEEVSTVLLLPMRCCFAETLVLSAVL